MPAPLQGLSQSSGKNAHLIVTRVDRQHAVIEELRASAPRLVSAIALAERTGVSTRTIERDVAHLQTCGVPVNVRRGPRGGYSIASCRTLAPLDLTPGEVSALIASLAALGPYASAVAASAMTKLVQAISGPE